ncbi:hypothetical protein KM043_008739 [Ampulex compressa]|nr:hypothetical protein KM043_008739 [Ampulex compressa]
MMSAAAGLVTAGRLGITAIAMGSSGGRPGRRAGFLGGEEDVGRMEFPRFAGNRSHARVSRSKLRRTQEYPPRVSAHGEPLEEREKETVAARPEDGLFYGGAFSAANNPRGDGEGPLAEIRHNPLRALRRALPLRASIFEARVAPRASGASQKKEGQRSRRKFARLEPSPRPDSSNVYEWKFADCEMDLRQGDAGTNREF